jgi:hypothetical protein
MNLKIFYCNVQYMSIEPFDWFNRYFGRANRPSRRRGEIVFLADSTTSDGKWKKNLKICLEILEI